MKMKNQTEKPKRKRKTKTKKPKRKMKTKNENRKTEKPKKKNQKENQNQKPKPKTKTKPKRKTKNEKPKQKQNAKCKTQNAKRKTKQLRHISITSHRASYRSEAVPCSLSPCGRARHTADTRSRRPGHSRRGVGRAGSCPCRRVMRSTTAERTHAADRHIAALENQQKANDTHTTNNIKQKFLLSINQTHYIILFSYKLIIKDKPIL
jgi:hypothetical protein